jgi:hypothetical protein
MFSCVCSNRVSQDRRWSSSARGNGTTVTAWLPIIVGLPYVIESVVSINTQSYQTLRVICCLFRELICALVSGRCNPSRSDSEPDHHPILMKLPALGLPKALLVWTIWHSSHHSIRFSLVGLFVVFRWSVVLNRRTGGSGKAR